MARILIPGSTWSPALRERAAERQQQRREWQSVGGAKGDREARIDGLWLNAKGEPVGEPMLFEPPRIELVEGFAAGGRIGAEQVARDLLIEVEPPADGRALLLMWGDDRTRIARDAWERVAALPGDPVTKPFPDESRSFYYPVFSDGFIDQTRFFSLVANLAHWILERPPFDHPGMEKRFGLKAYFWAAAAEGVSHFGAPLTGPMQCVAGAGTPVLLGSGQTAADLLGHLMPGGQGLVLMDSSQRGGAGGSPPHNYPAWASVRACPGEDWRKIALHEMAHSLGLKDEYVLPDLEMYRTWRDQPFERSVNVSNDADPKAAPWKSMLNLGGDESRPTVGLSEQDGAGWIDPRPGGKALVGTIGGAFYHEKYFRPSRDCLMRSLDVDAFCAVCQAHLLNKLGRPAPD